MNLEEEEHFAESVLRSGAEAPRFSATLLAVPGCNAMFGSDLNFNVFANVARGS
jgi:hypothetical protein